MCDLQKFFFLENVFVNEETSERFLNVQTEAKKRKQKQKLRNIEKKTEAKKKKEKLCSKMIRHLREAATKRLDLFYIKPNSLDVFLIFNIVSFLLCSKS